MTNCKDKLLKLEEKEKQWEKDAKLLVESEKDIKAKLVAKEKELHEKCEEVKNKYIVPFVDVDATSLSREMSQVKLKGVELTGLKQQNQNLEEISLKKEEEKKKLEERCQELINQNTKLTKQVVVQMALK